MNIRYSLLGGLAALALGFSLTGCDPGKSNNAAPPTPTMNGAPSNGATPTVAASPAVPEVFKKPRKADAKLLIKVITNGSDPFWTLWEPV